MCTATIITPYRLQSVSEAVESDSGLQAAETSKLASQIRTAINATLADPYLERLIGKSVKTLPEYNDISGTSTYLVNRYNPIFINKLATEVLNTSLSQMSALESSANNLKKEGVINEFEHENILDRISQIHEVMRDRILALGFEENFQRKKHVVQKSVDSLKECLGRLLKAFQAEKQEKNCKMSSGSPRSKKSRSQLTATERNLVETVCEHLALKLIVLSSYEYHELIQKGRHDVGDFTQDSDLNEAQIFELCKQHGADCIQKLRTTLSNIGPHEDTIFVDVVKDNLVRSLMTTLESMRGSDKSNEHSNAKEIMDRSTVRLQKQADNLIRRMVERVELKMVCRTMVNQPGHKQLLSEFEKLLQQKVHKEVLERTHFYADGATTDDPELQFRNIFCEIDPNFVKDSQKTMVSIVLGQLVQQEKQQRILLTEGHDVKINSTSDEIPSKTVEQIKYEKTKEGLITSLVKQTRSLIEDAVVSTEAKDETLSILKRSRFLEVHHDDAILHRRLGFLRKYLVFQILTDLFESVEKLVLAQECDSRDAVEEVLSSFCEKSISENAFT